MFWTRALIAFAVVGCHVDASQVYTTRLKRTKSISPSSKALAYHRLNSAAAAAAPLKPVQGGKGFNIDIVFGGKTFEVCFDTGSSDLWVPKSDFHCVGPDESDAPQSECHLGQTFPGSFSSGQIANQHFNITYGSGEFLLGAVGYEEISVAGVTVPNQEAALVNYGFWSGDDQTSGLLGFAYPFITSAYKGMDPNKDEIGVTQAPYSPFFFSAVKVGLVAPLFSLALDPEGGELTLGGIPSNTNTDDFISTPIRPTKLGSYAFYAIAPDGFVLQDQALPPSTGPLPLLVDSGTTLTFLPTQLALAVNEAFDPPAKFSLKSGAFETDCNATPPSFAVMIGGQAFHMKAENLLLQGELGEDEDTGKCVTGVQQGGDGGPFILGDTFLKNVVAVFDVGEEMMRFAAR